MSEPMLTRETIQKRLDGMKAYLERMKRPYPPEVADGIACAQEEAEIEIALCTLALSSIAMREALKPFAYIGQHKINPDWDDDAPVPERILNEGTCVEDFRRAAAAYNSQEQGK